MGEAREKLLAAVTAELDRHGIRDRSLRDIAQAAGTSHRMLIHHFGSRAGLLVAIVETVEAAERERAVAAGVAGETPDENLRAVYRTMWDHFADPALAGRERLFYECYARGLQGEEPFTRLLPGAVTAWLDALTDAQSALGVPEPAARARARLELAIVRGLILDLLATGDRRGTRAAIDEYVRLLERASG